MKSIKFTAILLIISTLAYSQNLSQKTFEGAIYGKIQIILTLNFDGNTIFGNVVYKKKGLPISVIGSVNGATYFLNELMPDGSVTGVYSATAKGDNLSGTWFPAKANGKELPLEMKKTEERSIPKKSIFDVTGTYSYQFGKEDANGELKVQQIGKDKIAISFLCITSPPAYNQAILNKTILKLVENKAIYSSTEYGKCKFAITFLENGAEVNYIEDSYDCGFGHNASTAGNYFKTNSSLPKFVKID
jgi:hypothetical protein